MKESASKQKTSLYVTAEQKARLQAMAEAAGFPVGRGSDSQLPAFLDHLMDSYDPTLPGETAGDIWKAFLDRLQPMVERVELQLGEHKVGLMAFLSREGGVYIQAQMDKLQVRGQAWRRTELGTAEREVMGRALVHILEDLAGFHRLFKSLTVANAFWTAIVKLVKNTQDFVTMHPYLRRQLPGDGDVRWAPLPLISQEDFVHAMLDAALEETDQKSEAWNTVYPEVIEFALWIAPEHARARIGLADIHAERGHYLGAVGHYQRASAALRERIPRQAFEEKDRVARSAWFHADGRYYMQAQRGLALALARSGRLEEGIKVMRAALRLQPAYSAGEQEVLMTLLLEAADPRLEKVLDEAQFFIDPADGKRRRAEESTVYLYTRAAWLRWEVGPNRRADDALRRAFDRNPYVPLVFERYADVSLHTIPNPWTVETGSIEEALRFARLALPSWRALPGLLDWLVRQGHASGIVREADALLQKGADERIPTARLVAGGGSQPDWTRGQVIAAARQAKGWTQGQLGREMAEVMARQQPVPQGTISQIEQGRATAPTDEMLSAVAQVLELDFDDLCAREP